MHNLCAFILLLLFSILYLLCSFYVFFKIILCFCPNHFNNFQFTILLGRVYIASNEWLIERDIEDKHMAGQCTTAVPVTLTRMVRASSTTTTTNGLWSWTRLSSFHHSSKMAADATVCGRNWEVNMSSTWKRNFISTPNICVFQKTFGNNS